MMPRVPVAGLPRYPGRGLVRFMFASALLLLTHDGLEGHVHVDVRTSVSNNYHLLSSPLQESVCLSTTFCLSERWNLSCLAPPFGLLRFASLLSPPFLLAIPVDFKEDANGVVLETPQIALFLVQIG